MEQKDQLTLAITTIGDLLLKEKITNGQDGKEITNIKLSVPEYQRPYKWTARNAIQLLDDIIEAEKANKEVYRVGTLILHKHEESGEYRYHIVDGQQRTITFALLLYALYEELNLNVEEVKFLNQEQNLFDNQYNRYNIPTNLNAYKRRLKGAGNISDDDRRRTIMRLRDYIENRCELIVVITSELSEAFQFFDSQNARGKALYPHDLLKAYHLREMVDIDTQKTEQIVKDWEKIPQYKLSEFFGDYLYRLKEWINGNWAETLNEHNIHKFKGVKRSDRTPYAQFYKSAYSYAEFVNNSAMPFVSGNRDVNAFQLNTPIIAGKPFFEYTSHYYKLLEDIRDNDAFVGFYVKGNDIVKTLDTYYMKGSGNKIARLLFNTALLLYVDRFCPATYPTQADTDDFEMFIVYAFIWAYSLRAQYHNLGWQSAQNYILGNRDVKNSFNIYKLISDADTTGSLLSHIADKLQPLAESAFNEKAKKPVKNAEIKGYMQHFEKYNFVLKN